MEGHRATVCGVYVLDTCEESGEGLGAPSSFGFGG